MGRTINFTRLSGKLLLIVMQHYCRVIVTRVLLSDFLLSINLSRRRTTQLETDALDHVKTSSYKCTCRILPILVIF